MDDGELLEALARSGAQLLEAARELDGMLPQPKLDPRWAYPTPLGSDLQLRHLFLQAWDATDLALSGLHRRTSAVAIGAVRYLAEAFTLICWLTDARVDDLERRKRAYRFALSSIVGTKDMLKHAGAAANAATMASLKEAMDTLHRLAHEDGIQYVAERPKAPHLFKEYTVPGYVLFSSLSEIGSHPGFLQMLVFHQDRATRSIDVNFTGQPGERAAWMNGAIDLFGRACDEIATWFGQEEWVSFTMGPIARDYAPLMMEAKARWESKWGLESARTLQETGTDEGG
jgi:hypothetical protein